MEWKIGEIKQVNGEWYQCVEGETICSECDLRNIICQRDTSINNPFKECSSNYRTDKKNIIFKKLEKVGEPFTCNIHGDERLVWMQEYKLYDVNFCKENALLMYVSDYKHKRMAIEIRQNKEDMEQQIEYFGYENNNAKHSNPESVGKNLRPFDLQKAREGKPVFTRDGRKARIICFDAEGNKPLIVLSKIDGKEVILRYTEKGQSDNFHSPTPREDDLMMLTEKKEGWVNVYYDNDASSHRGCRFIYDTKERAVKEAGSNYITTVKINWEE